MSKSARFRRGFGRNTARIGSAKACPGCGVPLHCRACAEERRQAKNRRAAKWSYDRKRRRPDADGGWVTLSSYPTARP